MTRRFLSSSYFLLVKIFGKLDPPWQIPGSAPAWHLPLGRQCNGAHQARN